MKATIKDTLSIAFFGISLLALPFVAHAAQDEHQRYLIQKAIKAKQEAKQQQAKPQEKKCDKSSEASSTEDKQTSN
ncbi:MAG TPA: hypothetical protein VEA39_04240 [Methylophilaceae bacterium]|nr:hypothetical protein [Methylophilaceae bacterium]